MNNPNVRLTCVVNTIANLRERDVLYTYERDVMQVYRYSDLIMSTVMVGHYKLIDRLGPEGEQIL